MAFCLYKHISDCTTDTVNIDIINELENYNFDFSQLGNDTLSFTLTASTTNKKGNPIYIDLQKLPLNTDTTTPKVIFSSRGYTVYIKPFPQTTDLSTIPYYEFDFIKVVTESLSWFVFNTLRSHQAIFNGDEKTNAWVKCNEVTIDIYSLDYLTSLQFSKLSIEFSKQYDGKVGTTLMQCPEDSVVNFNNIDYDVDITYFGQDVTIQQHDRSDFSSLRFESCHPTFNFNLISAVHSRFQSILHSASFPPIPATIYAAGGSIIHFEESAWSPLSSDSAPQFTLEPFGNVTVLLESIYIPLEINAQVYPVSIIVNTPEVEIQSLFLSGSLSNITTGSAVQSIESSLKIYQVQMPEIQDKITLTTDSELLEIELLSLHVVSSLSLLGSSTFLIPTTLTIEPLSVLTIDNFNADGSTIEIKINETSYEKGGLIVQESFLFDEDVSSVHITPLFSGVLTDEITDLLNGTRLLTLPYDFDMSKCSSNFLHFPIDGPHGLMKGISVFESACTQSTTKKGLVIITTHSLTEVYSQFLFSKSYQTPKLSNNHPKIDNKNSKKSQNTDKAQKIEKLQKIKNSQEQEYEIFSDESDWKLIDKENERWLTESLTSPDDIAGIITIKIAYDAPWVPVFDFSILKDSAAEIVIDCDLIGDDNSTRREVIIKPTDFFDYSGLVCSISFSNADILINDITGESPLHGYQMVLVNSVFNPEIIDFISLEYYVNIFADVNSILGLNFSHHIDSLIPINFKITSVTLSPDQYTLQYVSNSNDNTLIIPTHDGYPQLIISPQSEYVPDECVIQCNESITQEEIELLPELEYLSIGKTKLTIKGPSKISWDNYDGLKLDKPENTIIVSNSNVIPAYSLSGKSFTLQFDSKCILNGDLDVEGTLKFDGIFQVSQLTLKNTANIQGTIYAESVVSTSESQGAIQSISSLTMKTDQVESDQITKKRKGDSGADLGEIIVDLNTVLNIDQFQDTMNHQLTFKYDISQISQLNYGSYQSTLSPTKVIINNPTDMYGNLTRDHLKQWGSIPISLICGYSLFGKKNCSDLIQIPFEINSASPDFGPNGILDISCVESSEENKLCLILHSASEPVPTLIPTPPTSSSASKKSSKGGLIAGIVVCTVVIGVVVAAFIVYKIFRMKRNSGYEYENLDDPKLSL